VNDLAARFERLQTTIETAALLKPLVSEPVQSWFTSREAVLINDLIAHSYDAASTQTTALYLKAIRELRSFIDGAVAGDARAAAELEKIRGR